MKAVTSIKHYPHSLVFFLDFLVAWKKRPDSLAPFAFHWCCVFLEEAQSNNGRHLSGTTSHTLIIKALEAGFRFIHLDYRIDRIVHPDYASHLESIFRNASSRGDEAIADALCAWITHQDHTPHPPLEILFHQRKAMDRPLSPRLRQVSTRAIEDIWRKESKVPEVLLKCLDVELDEMKLGRDEWGKLILEAARSSPDGSLPLRYWRSLENLAHDTKAPMRFEGPRDVNTMKLLEKNGEWEKLAVWMCVIWQSSNRPAVTLVEDVERVTLKLLLQEPSALPRFEELDTRLKGSHSYLDRKFLELICTLARAKPMPSATQFPP